MTGLASKNDTGVSRIFGILLALLAWASTSFAAEVVKTDTVLKHDPTASSGKCLLKLVSNESDTDYWLNRYKIKTVDHDKQKGPARADERAAIASGLQQLEALWGGLFLPAVNTEFKFESRSGYSQQSGGKSYTPHDCKYISMNRCDSKGCKSNNVAHLMHELCHQIGHTQLAKGQSFQNTFAATVGRDCRVSGYSNTNLSEQFAEACSSFITFPERLFEKNQQCEKAFNNFFVKHFPNGNLASCKDNSKKRQLMAALTPGSGGTMVASAPVIAPVAVAIADTGIRRRPPPRVPATQVASIAPPGDDNFDSLGVLCKSMVGDGFDSMVDMMISISTHINTSL